MTKMSLGERIRRRRIELNKMSLATLSDITGLSIGHLSEIENGGRKNLQSTTIKKLATGLGLEVAELLDLIPDKEVE